MIQLSPTSVFLCEKQYQYHVSENFHRNYRTNDKLSPILCFSMPHNTPYLTPKFCIYDYFKTLQGEPRISKSI